jgi:single-strand DNA-binding protein
VSTHTTTAATGVNSVTLVGCAKSEPEIRYLESGSVCANLVIKVNRRGHDAFPDLFDLELWGKEAEKAGSHVRENTLIGIIGAFKTDRWKDPRSGEERRRYVIRVDRLEIL